MLVWVTTRPLRRSKSSSSAHSRPVRGMISSPRTARRFRRSSLRSCAVKIVELTSLDGKSVALKTFADQAAQAFVVFDHQDSHRDRLDFFEVLAVGFKRDVDRFADRFQKRQPLERFLEELKHQASLMLGQLLDPGAS